MDMAKALKSQCLFYRWPKDIPKNLEIYVSTRGGENCNLSSQLVAGIKSRIVVFPHGAI